MTIGCQFGRTEFRPQHNHALPLQLRATRISQGLTIEVLANRIGVDSSCVTRWERAKTFPSLLNLEAWANALGLDILLSNPKENTHD